MSEVMMASAVAMPDTECDEPPSDANGLKRRQSEEREQESNKRQRTSPGKSSPIEPPPEEHAQPRDNNQQQASATPEQDNSYTTTIAEERQDRRRKSDVPDEKQRSKRLFGALLGNLNQPRDRTSKRRHEIEARRKAELQRQDDERLEVKQKRAEQLVEQRRRVQERVDVENMRTRHKTMLDTANFLQTTAEPKLYYRPWELRPDEEDRIDEQIKQAQAQIDEELNPQGLPNADADQQADEVDAAAGEQAKEPDEPDLVPDEGSAQPQLDTGTEAQAKFESTDEQRSANVPDPSSVTNVVVEDAKEVSTHVEEHGTHDETEDDGDHVVDGDEDAVIY